MIATVLVRSTKRTRKWLELAARSSLVMIATVLVRSTKRTRKWLELAARSSLVMIATVLVRGQFPRAANASRGCSLCVDLPIG
ncbi:unnamed protein product [Arctia plantaginis]|uniref:Uncharacterized protein n=1 Tax=Arctia plantaginis TaxID=874455 RepID=A0A8S1A9Y0_ARCPL|nr:unnamed protein product [Arctia plantaginis]